VAGVSSSRPRELGLPSGGLAPEPEDGPQPPQGIFRSRGRGGWGLVLETPGAGLAGIWTSLYPDPMDYWKRAHRRRNYDDPGHAHELTFTCYRRFRFLEAERTCDWLARAIDGARGRLAFDLWAYVFMPEHAHLLLRPRSPDVGIAAILKSIKQPVGQRGVAFLKAHAPHWLPRISRVRAGRTERLFWQSGGGYDRNLVEPRTLAAVIDYLHRNPVRRGLVSRAEDWRWSSAGWFAGAESNPLRPDRIPPEWSVG
jgi:putative transposase